jgi:hypothetical protein
MEFRADIEFEIGGLHLYCSSTGSQLSPYRHFDKQFLVNW